MDAKRASHLDPAPAVARARLSLVLVTVVALLLLAAAVALVATSFLSYVAVKHRLDSFASDHDADLSEARFHSIVWQFRVAAVVAAGTAGAIYLARRRLAARLGRFAAGIGRDARIGSRTAYRALAAESRIHLVSLAATVLVALAVRIVFLFQPMRYDESDTFVHYASRPLYIGISAYTAPNNHILHTILVHASIAVFGDSPWAIRLPAFVAGVLLVPATYLAARLLYGRATALIAAALVAASSTLVEYSTNARGYTLQALLFLLLLAVATRLVEHDDIGAWAAFSLLIALGMWTIPTMLYGAATVIVWLAAAMALRHEIERIGRRLAPAVIGAAVITLVLYAPVLITAGPHALTRNEFVAPRTWGYFAHHLGPSLWHTAARWHRDMPLELSVVIAVLFVVGVVRHRRFAATLLSPALVAPVVILPILAVQRVVPFERVWLFLLPLYAITAAAGAVSLLPRTVARRDVLTTVAAVALCGSLGASVAASGAVERSEDTSTFRDAPAVAGYLERTLRPGDRVLVAPPADQILEYYLLNEGLDAGRLLYTGFHAHRLFAVVKLGPHEYSLRKVIRWRLAPGAARRLRPDRLAVFPNAVVYRLRPKP
jgi:Dolichyl-phosphate-mannose-protein mannosyltransferase